MKRILIGTAVLLAAGAVAAPSAAQTYEEQVVELVNIERWNNGQLAPLKHCAELDVSSENHSVAMGANAFFAHCDLDTGELPWDRMTAAGYSWNSAAENIAAGYGSPASVMTGWMNSSGHRANILSTSRREIGVGYYYDSGDVGDIRGDANGDCTADQFNKGPYYRYWTQNFGRRNAVYPVVIERERYTIDQLAVQLYVYGSGWATEMRFRNETGAWSDWEPYAADKSWTLSAGDGWKTVTCEITNGSQVKTQSDQILVEGAPAVTAVPDLAEGIGVAGLRVTRAFPNPFRSETSVAFENAETGRVSVRVFDVTGRSVALIVDDRFEPGRHEFSWRGLDDAGRQVSPGIYFFRVRSETHEATIKAFLSR